MCRMFRMKRLSLCYALTKDTLDDMLYEKDAFFALALCPLAPGEKHLEACMSLKVGC